MQTLGRGKVGRRLSPDGRFFDGWTVYYHDYDRPDVYEVRFEEGQAGKPFTLGKKDEKKKEHDRKRSFLKQQRRARQATSHGYTEEPEPEQKVTRRRGQWVRKRRPRR